MQAALYLITPDGWPLERLLPVIDVALAAGVRWLQYRDKAAEKQVRESTARQLLQRCQEHGARLIINDDIALAARIGAHGVHLGEDDAGLEQARAILGGNALLGSSCYDSLARARQAAADGADYLAFGAFFASPSKAVTRRADSGLLVAARALGKPLCAIGGIEVRHAATLVAAGADLIAVISGVFAAPDPGSAVRGYQDAIAAGLRLRQTCHSPN